MFSSPKAQEVLLDYILFREVLEFMMMKIVYLVFESSLVQNQNLQFLKLEIKLK